MIVNVSSVDDDDDDDDDGGGFSTGKSRSTNVPRTPAWPCRAAWNTTAIVSDKPTRLIVNAR